MALVEHAERELQMAGLFDADSDYQGDVGHAVLELVRVFAKQGHSGMSAHLTITAFAKVASYGVLTPLGNPRLDGNYMGVSYDSNTLQSTRKSSVFSEDEGRTWYDIDRRPRWWERLLKRKGRRVA